ncbi:hypothetical protein BSKO_01739 [Bryopsis sp. KO-2023]|nr:hypothetical protein BSKO_01739 [Bryopsis sp. KO-2023]
MDETLQLNNDREARILSRRKRIQERLAAKREGENAGNKDAEEKEEVGKGKQQMLESKRRLARIRHRTSQRVSSIRVASDNRENQRRISDELTRQNLRSNLLEEAEHSARQNAALAMRWADLFVLDVPQDLLAAIDKQQDLCQNIIESKDHLISEIKSELIRRDDDYVKLLKRQAEEIDLLVEAMKDEYEELQTAYREELEEIENALMEERKDLLQSNTSEMQQMFDKRGKLEQDFMERYLAAAEDYHKQLEDLRVADAEDYNVLKIRLETDIQNLEQHLEAMRATYQLNTEKLEYNYRVLVERDHENQSTINQQKRKISKQRDILSNLKSKYNDLDKKFQEENMKLMEEYKRITEHFKELQSKFWHFENVELKKFQDVWKMKEEDVAAVVKDVLMADKVIHEQQLGWDWLPPTEHVFISPHNGTGDNQNQEEAKEQGDSLEGSEEDGEDGPKGTKDDVRDRVVSEQYRDALHLLCDEVGFLVDAKARKLIESVPTDEQGLAQTEAILNAVGVVDGPTFDALMDALRAGSNIELRAQGVHTTDHDAGEEAVENEKSDKPMLIQPDEALRRLKIFVETENIPPTSKNTTKGMSSPQRHTGVSRRVVEKEKEFWRRLANIVGDKNYRVWNALHKHILKYHKNLSDRESSLEEVESLQKQNSELRGLLNQYLASKINEELQIPPVHVI